MVAYNIAVEKNFLENFHFFIHFADVNVDVLVVLQITTLFLILSGRIHKWTGSHCALECHSDFSIASFPGV